jgi:peptidyl-prolyl cis-trans isomerase SurA
MKKVFFACIVLWQAYDVMAQSANNIKPIVLFSIGSTPTYTEEFIYLYKKNHPNKSQDFTSEKVNEYLNLFVNFKLKVREAQQRGFDTTAKFNKELNTYRDELKKPYRADKDVLDKLTREAYDHLTQEVKASHILIQAKPDAAPADTMKAYVKIAEIKKRVAEGEDFGKLATELSEDPSAKYNGGSLGYFTTLQMVYPFEEAAYNTKVGDVSSVIRTRFGYHLVKVEDKRPSKGEVEVSHILLRTAKGGQTSRLKNTTEMDNDPKVKNLIFEIYDQLKSGRNWDDLCKEYSEDTNTKNAGGKLRPFGVGALAAVPEFEITAFALQKPGEVSDPFQSSIGWHIIRLEKRIPVPAYADIEATLKKRVARDERVKISEQSLAIARRKELGFNENKENKSKVMALADSNLVKGKWKFTGNTEIKKLVLFSLSNKVVRAADFFSWVEKRQTFSKLSPSSYLDQLYEELVDENVNEAEEEKIKKANPDFQYLLTEYREGILLFDIMEREVWNKASEDSIGQKNYYKEHIAKYSAGDRVEARIFSTTDKSFLEDMKKKVMRGDTLSASDMKKFKSVQNFRNYEKGESKVIDKINWVPGLQETEIDGTSYLAEIKRLVAPGTKTFTEARAHVISDYQDSLERAWVTSLKNKYHVTINSKAKEAVMKELTNK